MTLEQAARTILAAIIEDNGDPDDFPGDDGCTAWQGQGADNRPCALTFKMIRDLRNALRATE
jgi:hypothetical protein